MAHTFTIEAGGRERTFTLRPNLPLAVREWWSRVIDAFTANDSYERYQQIVVSPDTKGNDAGTFMYASIVNIVCKDRALLTEGMRTGFIGDHAGVEWYDDIDGDVTHPAIADLVAFFFVKAAKTMSGSSTSSRPIPTVSKESPAVTDPTSSER
jgi:hypothetical protein